MEVLAIACEYAAAGIKREIDPVVAEALLTGLLRASEILAPDETRAREINELILHLKAIPDAPTTIDQDAVNRQE
ncbi:hypothetical protein [Salinisphaera hydrothermalis]|uniref:hypothetical protein n=1 Tax=Salinisphaera hydrothermalis TaxID=563188 RepID=UPI0033425850